MKKLFLLIVVLISLLGCLPVLAPQVGMTRNQWVGQTLIGDQVYLDENWEVWKSGGKFYYFKDGKLDRIDQGQLLQERFQIENIQK